MTGSDNGIRNLAWLMTMVKYHPIENQCGMVIGVEKKRNFGVRVLVSLHKDIEVVLDNGES